MMVKRGRNVTKSILIREMPLHCPMTDRSAAAAVFHSFCRRAKSLNNKYRCKKKFGFIAVINIMRMFTAQLLA
jgi:hypothetical protein